MSPKRVREGNRGRHLTPARPAQPEHRLFGKATSRTRPSAYATTNTHPDQHHHPHDEGIAETITLDLLT
jgi:hypothetical protein